MKQTDQTDQQHEVLTAISAEFETAQPQDILTWATQHYGAGLVMATSFGLEGMCIMHMLHEIAAKVRIINLDTGYQFPETLGMLDKVKQRYGFTIELVKANTTVEQYEQQHHGAIYHKDPNQCCYDRKLMPLRQALLDMSAWISSIRRQQTPDRAQAYIVEWDSKFNLVKVNPLANWSQEQVWSFIQQHDIPYHPLYDRGFKSIGCWPCTRAVADDEAERAGRWQGFNKLECGLHSRTTDVEEVVENV